MFHNGQELTADDVVYSFQQMLNPPLPGTHGDARPGAGDRGRRRRLGKYQVQMDLKAPDARVYGFLAWGRYSAIVPNNMYQTLNPATQGIGTGPFMLNGELRPERPRQLRQEPALLEAGPAVPGRRSTTRSSPDEQTRIAAPQGRLDRRRDGLARQRRLDQRLPEADGAAQPDRGVPRAPVHDQGRATTSRGRTSASARRSTTRSTART